MLLLLAAALAAPLDVNTASAADLDALPGLGRSKAEAIVRHREHHGPFTSLEDLGAVSGLGPGTLAAMRGRIRFGETVLASASTTPPSQEARHPIVPSARPIDPNRATVVELAGLPGISGPRAEAIVADREANGPFRSCADLGRVEGVGPATVAALAELCTLP